MAAEEREREGEEQEYTSLKVTKRLTTKMKNIGKKGESYEDIIWRLIGIMEGGGAADMHQHEQHLDASLTESMEKLRERISSLEARVSGDLPIARKTTGSKKKDARI